MKREHFNPKKLAQPMATYAQCVKKGNIVYTSGQVSIDASGSVIGKGDIEVQTRQVINNLIIALKSAGAGLEDVIKVTIFLKEIGDYKTMNKVFTEYFKDSPPARSTVLADLVLDDFLIEIEAMAITG
ncbi:MAG: RidA family protein [Nitrospinae bacterium]|nr:RidA family protein [Nitrospinota bacterium]